MNIDALNKDLNPTRVGRIDNYQREGSKRKLRFVQDPNEDDKWCGQLIYFWVDEASKEVLYVGYARHGIRERMKQHEAGFRGGSKSGERRQSEILLENQQGINIDVYATKASENIKNSGANSDSENQCKQLKSLECQLINKIKPKLNYTYNRS